MKQINNNILMIFFYIILYDSIVIKLHNIKKLLVTIRIIFCIMNKNCKIGIKPNDSCVLKEKRKRISLRDEIDFYLTRITANNTDLEELQHMLFKKNRLLI